MKVLNIVLVLMLGIVMTACSKSEQGDGEHFASTQEKALDKAGDVEATIMEEEKKKREQLGMDEQAEADSGEQTAMAEQPAAESAEEAAPEGDAAGSEQSAEPAEPETGTTP